MQTIIVKNTPEEVLRAQKWWNGLESQWKMAFNEGLFGVGPTLAAPREEYLIMMLTRVDKVRLTGPLSFNPNISFRLTNLSGIEGLPNLNFLTISNCEISSLKPLRNHRKLEHLFLNNNGLKSLAGIEKLTNLKELYLNVNELTDLKELKKLTNLQTLYVNHNKLTSLEGIHEGHAKKLRQFYVEPNEDLPHKEIIRMQMECGIICRRG